MENQIESIDSDNVKSNRRKAQKYLLAEHVCNTLADRMWLYAAGLLLMEAISRIDPEITQISTASTYGLVISVFKVALSPSVGSMIEQTSRFKGAMIPLVIQNTSVAVSAMLLTIVLMSDDILAKFPVWALFTVITFFSSIAILASAGLMNVISRDWAVEISTEDELTYLNAWLRSIDQATLVLSAGLSGFAIAIDQGIGAVIVGVLNIVAMGFQAFFLCQIYKLVPKLAEKPPRIKPLMSKTIGQKIKQKLKFFVDGWILLFKSEVVIPGVVLAILYINILGMNFQLQGYAREACLSEATISILFISGAISGFIAPISFPFLVRVFGLIGTGLGGCLWQIGFIGVSVIALFLPGSSYIYHQEDNECLFNQTTINQTEIDTNQTEIYTNNFWMRCPPGVTPPTSYISIGLIFASAIFQRWGVYIFDMITTQLFQIDVKVEKRNRVSAGQYSLNSIFEIGVFGLSLIWSTACVFGNAILTANAIMICGYCMYIYWSLTSTSVLNVDGELIRVRRLNAFKIKKGQECESEDN